MSKIYVGDVGTVIKVGVGQDVSGASNISIEVQKPGGAGSASWPATGVSGEPTKIQHIIEVNDLDVGGNYACQAKLTLGAWSGRGETFQIKVSDPYK